MSHFTNDTYYICPFEGVTIFPSPKIEGDRFSYSKEAIKLSGLTGIEPFTSYKKEMDVVGDYEENLFGSDSEDEEFDEDLFGPDSGNYFDALLEKFGIDRDEFFNMLSKIYILCKSFDEKEIFKKNMPYNIYKILHSFLCHGDFSLGSCMGYEPELKDFSVEEAVRFLINMKETNYDFYENLDLTQMMSVYNFVKTLYEYLVESGKIEDGDEDF